MYYDCVYSFVYTCIRIGLATSLYSFMLLYYVLFFVPVLAM